MTGENDRNNPEHPGGYNGSCGIFGRVAGFFGGAGFPVFAIASTLVYLGFLAAAVFSPSGESVWGSFVRDFREWCFDYDAASGRMEWTWVWIMFTQPVFLLGIVGVFWRQALAGAWQEAGRGLWIPALAGAGAAAAVSAVLLVLAWEGEEETLAFPAERIRTSLTPPDFALEDQHGETIALRDFRGEVVLLTAIYSTCGTACPMLAVQAKQSMEALPEQLRERVTLMAVSLDPGNDSREHRAAAAEAFGLADSGFHFLNGDADEVNTVLDRLQVTRYPNRTTGEIDHANLYFLIDADGLIAYRLNLSDRHEEWLTEGLRVLAEESLAFERRMGNRPENRDWSGE